MITILQDIHTIKLNSVELQIVKNAIQIALEADAKFYEKHPSVKKLLDEILSI